MKKAKTVRFARKNLLLVCQNVNNTQCFPDRSRKVYAKSHEKTVGFYLEKTVGFYLEKTFNLVKDYFSSAAFTSWVPELQYESRQHQSLPLEKTPWFFVKPLQYESKSSGKTLKIYVKIQTRLTRFTWGERWTGFQKCALLVSIPYKYLKTFSQFYSVNAFYPTNSAIFNVVFLNDIQKDPKRTSNL